MEVEDESIDEHKRFKEMIRMGVFRHKAGAGNDTISLSKKQWLVLLVIAILASAAIVYAQSDSNVEKEKIVPDEVKISTENPAIEEASVLTTIVDPNTEQVETSINENTNTGQVTTTAKENPTTEQVETSTENTLIGVITGTGATGYRDVYYPATEIPDRFELKMNAEGYADVPLLVLEDFEVDGLLIKFTLVNPTEREGYFSATGFKVQYNRRDTDQLSIRFMNIDIGSMTAYERRPMTMGGEIDKEGMTYIEGLTFESKVR